MAARLALFLALGLFACIPTGNGSGCQDDTQCSSSICCSTCGGGPCQGANQGVCCLGRCDADGGCPAGSSCSDAGICL